MSVILYEEILKTLPEPGLSSSSSSSSSLNAYFYMINPPYGEFSLNNTHTYRLDPQHPGDLLCETECYYGTYRLKRAKPWEGEGLGVNMLTGHVYGSAHGPKESVPRSRFVARLESFILKSYIKLMKQGTSSFPVLMFLPEWEKVAKKYQYVKSWNGSKMVFWKEMARQLGERHYRMNPIAVGFPTLPMTGVHLSTVKDGVLAFYPDYKSVASNIAVQIKPGRYLKKFFPQMSDDAIRIASALISKKGYELEVVEDYKTIKDIYMEMDASGVACSCMSNKSKSFQGHLHPLAVYDYSDVGLLVMYRKSDSSPRARALFNKKTLEYPIIYGEWEKMEALAYEEGYSHGSLTGAKIKKIKTEVRDRTAYIMPYIDAHRSHGRTRVQCTHVEDIGDHWLITPDGLHEADKHEDGILR